MNRISVFSVFLFAGIGFFSVATAYAGAPAERAWHRGLSYMENSQYDEAIRQFSIAIRLDPRQAKYFGLRATAWLAQSEYARAKQDLETAIRLNPGDAGQQYRPVTDKKLSPQALEHGRQQLKKMLQDRPAMAEHTEKTQFLRDWAIRKFAGEDLGSSIDWDPNPPLHSDAEHLAPTETQHAAILLAPTYNEGQNAGKPRSFEELWAGAVYELHNVKYVNEFVRLNDEAHNGKLSKKAFVAGIVKYELKAAQETRAFYLQVMLPWLQENKLKTNGALWFCDWWDSPATALHSFTNKAAYPWRPYARVYDWATVHRYWRLGRVAKALNLLRQMREEAGYEEEQADLDYWIERCHQRLQHENR